MIWYDIIIIITIIIMLLKVYAIWLFALFSTAAQLSFLLTYICLNVRSVESLLSNCGRVKRSGGTKLAELHFP